MGHLAHMQTLPLPSCSAVLPTELTVLLNTVTIHTQMTGKQIWHFLFTCADFWQRNTSGKVVKVAIVTEKLFLQTRKEVLITKQLNNVRISS